MNLPRSVSDVVAERVTFEVECIEWMYLNVYVPGLQYPAGLVGYVHRQLGLPIASTAPLAKITDRFAAAVHRYSRDQRIPWVDFVRGQRKDDVMHQQLAEFDATGRTEGVVFIGRAQETTMLFRTEKQHNADGRPYPWIVRATGVVNRFYFYCVDADFGPFFIKFCSYFLYNAKLWVNGHEWAKRQATAAGIGYTELSNGFAACDDPEALQAICDRLGPGTIDMFFQRWLARLPLDEADRTDGYWWELSMRQIEVSRTIVFDAPRRARAFFEALVVDNLDIGRPESVELIYTGPRRTGRRPTVGCVPKTKIVTRDTDVIVNAFFKHSRVKQYLKDGRALRIKTVVNSPDDLRCQPRLVHLDELQTKARAINHRLLDTERVGQGCVLANPALSGSRSPPSPRMAGGRPRYGSEIVNQMSYDLARLRMNGLIERIPHSNTYTLTPDGQRVAIFSTKVHDRLLRPLIAADHPPAPADLRQALRTIDQHVNGYIDHARLGTAA